MVEEIYVAIEPRENPLQSAEANAPLRNGDVRNPRVKETRRPDNYLLRDLIRILIIRELLQGGWQANMPRPPMGEIARGMRRKSWRTRRNASGNETSDIWECTRKKVK